MSEEHFVTVRDGKVYVTTSTGVVVQCLPYFNELMIAGSALAYPDEPPVPTYALKDADGDEYAIPYTQEAVDDPKTPAEDRERWAAYLQLRDAYEIERAKVKRQKDEKQIRLLALKATRLVDVDLDAWAREYREDYGIATPDDPKERLLAYFSTEVIKEPLDGARLFAGIARASGMTEAQLDAIEDQFRRPLGGTGWDALSADTAPVAAGNDPDPAGLVDGGMVE